MTYRVLLVDDEPIILSGIKFLINWEQNGCRVAGTARNGRQALEFIEQSHPEIVICDINMPVFSGIELLQAMAEREDAPAFIMLTNHEEFDLARQSLRYKAVDYLLKTHLEAETLEHSLGLAKQECERRGSLARVHLAESYLESNKSQIVADRVKELLSAPGGAVSADCLETLAAQGVTDRFCLIQLMMDFSALPTLDTFSGAERERLYAWEQEVVEKLAGNVFPSFAAFDPNDRRQSLALVCWDLPDSVEDALRRFYAKLCAASDNITQARLSLLATQVLHGADGPSEAARQLSELREYHYLSQCEYAAYDGLPPAERFPLCLDDLGSKLVSELRAKNAPKCAALLDSAAQKISTVPHTRTDALNACATLYSVASMVLPSMITTEEAGDYFSNSAGMMRVIRRLTTRREVLAWLEEFSCHVTGALRQMTEGKSELTEKAKRYVQENVNKRIMLQDVADFVNLSPSYLSALFKREYNQNLVDFINATKTEHACGLIREGKYRIYEISYMLGFENAYYFTKVFKKHTGLTPTEYQHKVRKGNDDG